MNLRSTFSAGIATSAVLLGGGAFAGGYVAPVADVPLTAAPTAPVADWAGGYAGLSLGYSFGGDDEVGFDFYEGDDLEFRNTDLTNVKVKGFTGDLHAGYRWQRGSWVFGPELAIEGGSVDAKEGLTVTAPDEFKTDGTIESSVNYIASLVFKTGYAVNPQTLIYGTAGVTHGDFDYKIATPDDSSRESYSANGYVLGLGVERKVSDRMSVFAEYQYRDFGNTDVTFNDPDPTSDASIVSKATPTHQNLKVGINFRF